VAAPAEGLRRVDQRNFNKNPGSFFRFAQHAIKETQPGPIPDALVMGCLCPSRLRWKSPIKINQNWLTTLLVDWREKKGLRHLIRSFTLTSSLPFF
jgi:hypothetical protein